MTADTHGLVWLWSISLGLGEQTDGGAGIRCVSFVSLAERLEGRKICHCTTMCELAAREQRWSGLKYPPLLV